MYIIVQEGRDWCVYLNKVLVHRAKTMVAAHNWTKSQ